MCVVCVCVCVVFHTHFTVNIVVLFLVLLVQKYFILSIILKIKNNNLIDWMVKQSVLLSELNLVSVYVCVYKVIINNIFNVDTHTNINIYLR